MKKPGTPARLHPNPKKTLPRDSTATLRSTSLRRFVKKINTVGTHDKNKGKAARRRNLTRPGERG